MTLTKTHSKNEDGVSAEAMKTVRGIVSVMTELAQIMREEADLLDQHRYGEHKELLKRKQRLTLDYRTTMKTFSSQPDMLKKMPDNVRVTVRDAAQKLSDVADRNARSLRSAVVAVQRLLQSIMKIIKSEALPTSRYENPKMQHMKLGTYSPTCKPVAVTRTA